MPELPMRCHTEVFLLRRFQKLCSVLETNTMRSCLRSPLKAVGGGTAFPSYSVRAETAQK